MQTKSLGRLILFCRTIKWLQDRIMIFKYSTIFKLYKIFTFYLSVEWVKAFLLIKKIDQPIGSTIRNWHKVKTCLEQMFWQINPKLIFIHWVTGWSKNPVSSQTDKLMAGTKFSNYLGLKHYKKAKKHTFQPFRLGL